MNKNVKPYTTSIILTAIFPGIGFTAMGFLTSKKILKNRNKFLKSIPLLIGLSIGSYTHIRKYPTYKTYKETNNSKIFEITQGTIKSAILPFFYDKEKIGYRVKLNEDTCDTITKNSLLSWENLPKNTWVFQHYNPRITLNSNISKNELKKKCKITLENFLIK